MQSGWMQSNRGRRARARLIIDTERQLCCPLCGSAGETVYEDLRDHLFGAPGVWAFKRCPACDALWLDPRPTQATIGEAYETYYTHGNQGVAAAIVAAAIRRVARERAAQLHGFGQPTPIVAWVCALATRFYPGLADHADAVVSHLQASEIVQGARVLEVGCGDGNGVSFLNSLGLRASGVEIDPLAVKAARMRGLEVAQGDIGSAGIADDSFDVVTSAHVLEHVHDARSFLTECRRVLKPGGVLVAMTPNARSELLARHGRNWRGLEPPRHLLLFNADNLARLASDVGFLEVRVKRTAHLASFIHIASTSIAADGRPLRSWAVLRLWLESKVIESRMTRDVLHAKSEGAELALIARK